MLVSKWICIVTYFCFMDLYLFIVISESNDGDESLQIIQDLPLRITFYSNESMSLDCNIDGYPSPQYQWYMSTSEIHDYEFVKVRNSNRYLKLDGRKFDKKYFKHLYYCKAQNRLGTLHSNFVIVERVELPKSISIHYTKYDMYEEEKYVFECNIDPDLLAPLFKFIRWEVKQSGRKTLKLTKTVGRYSVITLTKHPQLHIRNVNKIDFDEIGVRCVFQNKVGNQENLDSRFQRLYKFRFMALTKIVCEGKTINVYEGTTVELPLCNVPKTLGVTWTWSSLNNDQVHLPINYVKGKIEKADKLYENLKITNISKGDSGKYTATMINNSPTKTVFTVNVFEKIRLELTPKFIKTKLGVEESFKCQSNYNVKIVWWHNGRMIGSTYGNIESKINKWPKSSELIIKKNGLFISGFYQCTAILKNEITGYQELKQVYGYLLISDFPPSVVKQSPRAERNTGISHVKMTTRREKLSIQCTFAALPKPTIQWYLHGEKIPIRNASVSSVDIDRASIYYLIVKNEINLFELPLNKRREYAGEYKAVATNAFGSSSCTFFVFYDGELEVRLPSIQTIMIRKNVTFSCYFISMGLPQFSWEKFENGNWVRLPTSVRTLLINQRYHLLIEAVTVTDAGRYRCKAKYKSVEKIGKTELVVAKPINVMDIGNKSLDIKEVTTRTCRVANSADKPWYAWWTFNSHKDFKMHILKPKSHGDVFKKLSITYNSSESRMTQTKSNITVKGIPSFLYNYPNHEANLHFYIREHDNYETGIFTCQVKNHFGLAEAVIKDALELEFDLVPRSVNVVVEDSISINCTAKENGHNPSIKWKLQNGVDFVDINDLKTLYGNRIFQYDNGTLVIQNIKPSDPSKLYCFIISSIKTVERKSRVSYINIKYPSKIIKSKTNIEKVSGDSFNLTCNVYGHDEKLIVKWFHRPHNGEHWKELSQRCIYSHDNECTNQYEIKDKFSTKVVKHNRTYYSIHLEIIQADKLFTGYYKCQSSNKFNDRPDIMHLNLTIISKPSDVVIFPNNEIISSKIIGVYWEKPKFNGNKPITGYIIQYFELKESENNSTNIKIIKVNQTVTSITIEKLKPNRVYDVSIMAVNEVGNSEPSSIHLKTSESKPERPVRDLKAVSNKPNEIFIFWAPPDVEYQNGVIQYYQVCYQSILPQENGNIGSLKSLVWPTEHQIIILNTRVKCQNTNDVSLKVSELPQFTDFGIRVIAINKMGPSPPDYTTTKTLEDLPLSAPNNIICDTKQHSIKLDWNPPPLSTLNGVLIGYLVQYYERNDFGDESGMRSLNIQSVTSIVIKELKPNTVYWVKVMAVNRKGQGPPSSNVVCVTKEAPPEKPEQVKAIAINNTCIMVSWLHTKMPNGIIQEYCAVIKDDQQRSIGRRKCQPPDFSKRYNKMILCNDYRIPGVKVFARNNFDGVAQEFNDIVEYGSSYYFKKTIFSIGGTIKAKQENPVVLPCETYNKAVIWRNDAKEIQNGTEYQIFTNHSLLVKSVETYGPFKFTCYDTESDSIDYMLNVEETPDGLPRPPYISNSRVTENSLFINWKSGGTTDITAPIIKFILTWTNLYNNNQKTVYLKGKSRTYYLKDVTCASDFVIKLRAENKFGLSGFSNVKNIRTLGDVPQIPDTKVLLPNKNIYFNRVNFNLKSFGSGNKCQANRFILEVTLSQNGRNDYNTKFFNKNISISELKDECCYIVTELNPSTHYIYRITAINPAGSKTVEGNFITSTRATVPRERSQTEKAPESGYWWLLIILFIVLVSTIVIIAILVILYVIRARERGKRNITQNDKVGKIEPKNYKYEADNISNDSTGEPSPYAVYQPDSDHKISNWTTTQMSKSNIGSNYPDNLYNQVQYNTPNGPTPNGILPGAIRRANSAECLSSNASVSGIGDLESPGHMEAVMNERRNRYSDEIFNNINPQFSTLGSRKNLEREATMNYSSYNKQIKYPNRTMFEAGPSQKPQADYYRMPVHMDRPMYSTQMSMPEKQISHYHINPGQHIGRQRSDSGANHINRSQVPLLNSSMQSSQYNSQYASQYNPIMGNPSNYSSSKSISNNYGPIDKRSMHYGRIPSNNHYLRSRESSRATDPNGATSKRPELQDENIYTDRVVVV